MKIINGLFAFGFCGAALYQEYRNNDLQKATLFMAWAVWALMWALNN